MLRIVNFLLHIWAYWRSEIVWSLPIRIFQKTLERPIFEVPELMKGVVSSPLQGENFGFFGGSHAQQSCSSQWALHFFVPFGRYTSPKIRIYTLPKGLRLLLFPILALKNWSFEDFSGNFGEATVESFVALRSPHRNIWFPKEIVGIAFARLPLFWSPFFVIFCFIELNCCTEPNIVVACKSEIDMVLHRCFPPSNGAKWI